MEIWNGPESEAVRQQHLKPETLQINACKNCFMPYDFVSPITNNYLHFNQIKLPGLSGDEFASSVIAFWEGMNETMEDRSISKLGAFVMYAFSEINSGRPLSTKKKNLETTDQIHALSK